MKVGLGEVMYEGMTARELKWVTNVSISQGVLAITPSAMVPDNTKQV